MRSITRSRSRRQRLLRRRQTRRRITRKGRGSGRGFFTYKSHSRRSGSRKQRGGAGIEEVEEARDPVIAIIGGVPVGTTAGTLKSLDRSEAADWMD